MFVQVPVCVLFRPAAKDATQDTTKRVLYTMPLPCDVLLPARLLRCAEEKKLTTQ